MVTTTVRIVEAVIEAIVEAVIEAIVEAVIEAIVEAGIETINNMVIEATDRTITEVDTEMTSPQLHNAAPDNDSYECVYPLQKHFYHLR